MNKARTGSQATDGPVTWVFGYGSLIWRQDFPYLDAKPAWIDGYERRFWQGSHDHRGRQDAPGRVVTLIESPGERCQGRAFLVSHDVFDHLDHREKNGYVRYELAIHFADGSEPGVTYVASHENEAFLGSAPLERMVEQIRRSSGESGPNTDYVLELANALRDLAVDDPHVFEIEAALQRAMDQATT
jgi:cation transport regulator ChaC